MELIKENKEKGRAIYKTSNSYIKFWFSKDLKWIESHVNLLKKFAAHDYVLTFGSNNNSVWAEFKVIKGTVANTFPHTEEFIERIVNFCKNNYKETFPYAHGDWVLSNMIINNDEITLCDWDNLGIYNEQEVWKKMESDLVSAFGERVKDYFK